MPITIHGVPRSRELIIQNKSIVNRLLVDFQYPITEGLFEFFFSFFFFFVMLYWDINLSQMQL